jgi:hypothetical protein
MARNIKNIHKLNLGFLPSPKDKRDFRLGMIQAPSAIPEVYLPEYDLPTYHQHKQPSCIGHAVAWMVTFLEWTELKVKTPLSPRFIYALAKRDDGIPNVDGTYYRQGLEEALKYGVSTEKLFPNNTDLSREEYNNASLISQEALEDADYKRIKSYVRVDDVSFNGLKQAIFNNKVVLLGINIGDTMWTDVNGVTTWSESKIMPLRVPSKIVSGHAVVAIGYDKDYIYFKNSWGDVWARKGTGYFGKNYTPLVVEAWTVVDLSDEEIKRIKEDLSKQLSTLQTMFQALLKRLGLR